MFYVEVIIVLLICHCIAYKYTITRYLLFIYFFRDMKATLLGTSDTTIIIIIIIIVI